MNVIYLQTLLVKVAAREHEFDLHYFPRSVMVLRKMFEASKLVQKPCATLCAQKYIAFYMNGTLAPRSANSKFTWSYTQ